jgi:hypothetical protein
MGPMKKVLTVEDGGDIRANVEGPLESELRGGVQLRLQAIHGGLEVRFTTQANTEHFKWTPPACPGPAHAGRRFGRPAAR